MVHIVWLGIGLMEEEQSGFVSQASDSLQLLRYPSLPSIGYVPLRHQASVKTYLSMPQRVPFSVKLLSVPLNGHAHISFSEPGKASSAQYDTKGCAVAFGSGLDLKATRVPWYCQ